VFPRITEACVGSFLLAVEELPDRERKNDANESQINPRMVAEFTVSFGWCAVLYWTRRAGAGAGREGGSRCPVIDW